MREYELTILRPDGSKGRIVLQARTSTEAKKLAGNPNVINSKSAPWKYCGGDCGDCNGCGGGK